MVMVPLSKEVATGVHCPQGVTSQHYAATRPNIQHVLLDAIGLDSRSFHVRSNRPS